MIISHFVIVLHNTGPFKTYLELLCVGCSISFIDVRKSVLKCWSVDPHSLLGKTMLILSAGFDIVDPRC